MADCNENSNLSGRVNMTDVARIANVSVATVSRVLNNAPGVSDRNRARIAKLIEELGYQPNFTAQNLVQRSTRTIALINMSTLGYLHAQPASGRILLGIEQALSAENYRYTIFSRDDLMMDEAELGWLKDGSVDGVLLNGAKLNDPLALKLKEYNLPFVIIGRAIGLLNNYYVDVDNVYGSYSAVQALLKLGHKRIAHVCGSQQTNLGVERLEGYRRALIDAGVGYNEEYVIDAGLTREEVYRSVYNYFKDINPALRPTGIFAFNDFIAIPTMRALLDLDLRIPDDIAIIGFDDDETSKYLNPPLASIHAPIYELGMEAAKMLLALINNGQQNAHQVILEAKVIKRASLGVSDDLSLEL